MSGKCWKYWGLDNVAVAYYRKEKKHKNTIALQFVDFKPILTNTWEYAWLVPDIP